jgi:hypothetical protein
MRGRAIDKQLKTCVCGALLAGLSVSDVARKYNLPKSTVCRFRASLGSELEQVGTDMRRDMEQLLLSHTEENLQALSKMAQHAHDRGWLMKQNAVGVAKFYGVVATYTLRLLESVSLADDSVRQSSAE